MVLDGILVAASLFVLSWVTAFGQTLSGGGESFSLAVSLAYPIGDLLLLTVTLLVVVTHASQSARLGLWLLATAFAALSIADSGFAYLTAIGQFGTGNLIDAGWVAGFAVLALAAIKDRSGAESASSNRGVQTRLCCCPTFRQVSGLALAVYQIRSGHSDDVSLVFAVVIMCAVAHASAAGPAGQQPADRHDHQASALRRADGPGEPVAVRRPAGSRA